MVRITIDDLPILEDLSQQEMASLFGGTGPFGGGGADPLLDTLTDDKSAPPLIRTGQS